MIRFLSKLFPFKSQTKRIIFTSFSSSSPSLSLLLSSSSSSSSSTSNSSFLSFFLTSSFLLYSSNSLTSNCENNNNNNNSSSSSSKILRSNFIADAASIIAPTVVNIVSKSHSLLPMATAGSGFIISKDGYIVTNAHVVSTVKIGEYVEVTLSDLRQAKARLHSFDKQSDIAIIQISDSRINTQELPVATLGKSSTLRAGEFVVAVGSPLQLRESVTFGIISAPARHSSELGMVKAGTDYIQTDAAINTGNSGGPLVNLDGEVIGINTMKAQGYDGISFAIPIDTASLIIQQLLRNKKVMRPYVGLKMINVVNARQSIDPSNPNNRNYVLVTDVVPDSPACRAGIKSGDVLLSINGRSISHTKDVQDSIGLEAGKTLEIKAINIEDRRGDVLDTSHERIIYLATEPQHHQHEPYPPPRHF